MDPDAPWIEQVQVSDSVVARGGYVELEVQFSDPDRDLSELYVLVEGELGFIVYPVDSAAGRDAGIVYADLGTRSDSPDGQYSVTVVLVDASGKASNRIEILVSLVDNPAVDFFLPACSYGDSPPDLSGTWEFVYRIESVSSDVPLAIRQALIGEESSETVVIDGSNPSRVEFFYPQTGHPLFNQTVTGLASGYGDEVSFGLAVDLGLSFPRYGISCVLGVAQQTCGTLDCNTLAGDTTSLITSLTGDAQCQLISDEISASSFQASMSVTGERVVGGPVTCGGAICTPSTFRACDTEQPGVCADGTQACSLAGDSWGACVRSQSPVDEICGNRLDDDCDELVDDSDPDCGVVLGCDPDATEFCNTGQAGVCGPGTRTCNSSGSAWSQCQRVQNPSVEMCSNGFDDDCDGQVDAADGDCAPAPRLVVQNGFRPHLSPDGTRVVFARLTGASVSATSDIWVVNVDGSDLRRLTNTPNASEVSPQWTPDGSRIAFVRKQGGYFPSSSGAGMMFDVRPDGLDERERYSFRVIEDFTFVVSFGRPAVLANLDGLDGLWLSENFWPGIDGGGFAQRTASGTRPRSQSSPVFSDGTSPNVVTYRDAGSNGSSTGAMVFNPISLDATRVENEGSYQWPSLSPSGSLVIAGENVGVPQLVGLYTMARDGSSPLRITESVDLQPSWSRDVIVFVRLPAGGTTVELGDIYQIELSE